MSLVLEIPDSIQQALPFPGGQQLAELFKELAVALYARDALSFGKACELSKLDRLQFGRLLAQREVPRHYGEEELERDWNFSHWVGLGKRAPENPAPRFRSDDNLWS